MSEGGDVHKVLICGDVKGKLKALCSRVSNVIKAAGNFDMMFCLGDFFGQDTTEINDLLQGFYNLPIPTYVVAPIQGVAKTYADEKGSKICENLVILGKGGPNILTFTGSQGIYTTVSGLRVVYISTSSECSEEGVHASSSLLSNAIAAEDIGFIGVDLLLTPKWPFGINGHLALPLPDECVACNVSGLKAISRLAYFLRPRYHFSSGNGSYFERPPYRNHRVLQEKASHVTRFIALANVKNPLNRKYLYALKLVPIEKMDRADLISQPSDVTENPYRELIEQDNSNTGKETEVQTEQYFYDFTDRKRKHERVSKKYHPKQETYEHESDETSTETNNSSVARKRRAETLEEKLEKPREQAACWFCLGNPQVKKHLIVSVNTQAYLALPRGPLVTDHVLILTVGHHRSWTSCPDYVRLEIDDYKARLKRMYTDQGKAMVAFERNLKTQHYQLQVTRPFTTCLTYNQPNIHSLHAFDSIQCVYNVHLQSLYILVTSEPREQAACWFCLGNPQVKKHLIVSVNTQAYLALPRGPLVTDHVLILTVGHHRSWTSCPDYVRLEIDDYKARLKRMYTDQGKAMVAFERNLKTQHYQLQICAPGIPYFYVELPTGERLFGQIKKDRIATSDIQFGRYVLSDSRILDCPDKADWRNCTEEFEQEAQLTNEMREKFGPYDVA
ncbi:hypothetical protein AHF37_05536 [Paragonimus kellicotti]|nr:hypothetical protein AHF37_05536 [Paragonimus kellicotti]